MTTGRIDPENRLASFLRAWLDDKSMAPLALSRRAGVPHAILSGLFNHGHTPRPITLRKLAATMGVPVGELLVIAGYITPEEYANPIRETDLARLYEIGDLSSDEWEQVRDFARYVRGKRRSEA